MPLFEVIFTRTATVVIEAPDGDTADIWARQQIERGIDYQWQTDHETLLRTANATVDVVVDNKGNSNA